MQTKQSTLGKPYKGNIRDWTICPFDSTRYLFAQPTLGYTVRGRFETSSNKLRITSAVVRRQGFEIETLNSRYTLVGEGDKLDKLVNPMGWPKRSLE
jgi:hypothetical protein